jgi:hypothetical protein
MTETVNNVCHGMYSPIVTLTVSAMVYTYLLKRWHCRSWYVLTYYNIDSFSHGICLPIETLGMYIP